MGRAYCGRYLKKIESGNPFSSTMWSVLIRLDSQNVFLALNIVFIYENQKMLNDLNVLNTLPNSVPHFQIFILKKKENSFLYRFNFSTVIHLFHGADS